MPTGFRFTPHGSNQGNRKGDAWQRTGRTVCGAKQDEYARGLDLWQKWYDSTGTPVPELVPGSDMVVRANLTADHGGQAWFMIACGTEFSEDVDWTFLERSLDDRDHHFMPSNPTIFAWETGEFAQTTGGISTAKWHVPSSFSCTSDVAVGRWLSKNCNGCNDANNLARPTEPFVLEEFAAVVHAYDPSQNIQTVCTNVTAEMFHSCFDFKLASPPTSAPQPTPPTQAPTQAPAPTTPAPAPTQVPPSPAPTPPAAGGTCCWGGCAGGNCQGGWCGESQGNCEGNCDGAWCPAAAGLAFSASTPSLRSSNMLKAVAKHE